MENVATYSEARSEYTKQLATFIVPTLVGWFQQLWARNASHKNQSLALFQSDCEEVSRWNQDRIHDEVRVLIEKSGCDYMEELMTAVFVAHTKVLTAVRLSTKQKKLSITVPKLDHFIHRIFREAARSFWKTPFLFMADGGVVERQKNVLQIEALASEAITTAVRSLLPVKQILKDYLEDDADEEIEDEVVPASASASASAPEAAPAVAPAVAPEVEEVVTAPAPDVAESEEATDASDNTNPNPSIVKIDTEPSVTFADHKAVFADGNVTMEHMVAEDDEDEDDEDDDGPSDGVLKIEGPPTPVGAEDLEDLDAPPKKELLDDSIVVLD